MRTADVAKVHNPRRRQWSGSPFLLHVTEFARKTRESCGCTFAGEQRTKAIAEKWPIQLLDCTRQRAVVFNDLPLCGLFAVAHSAASRSSSAAGADAYARSASTKRLRSLRRRRAGLGPVAKLAAVLQVEAAELLKMPLGMKKPERQ
jgi:hypothetical protein